MRPDEAMQQLRALKAGLESEAISQGEFDAELGRFVFEDESGQYWTIGAQTEKWYVYRDGDWVPASPPALLERVERDISRPQETPDAREKAPRSGAPRAILIGGASLLFVVCLALVAVASYQYGRMSTLAPLPTPSATTSMVVTPAATVPSRATPTSGGQETPETDGTTPMPTPTVDRRSPTAITRSSATPSYSPTSTSVRAFAHQAPVLVGPEDGVERGPGYYAVLTWEPVRDLKDDEYYHVEVCWNNCSAFSGDYVRDTSWIFPDFHRGAAIDGAFYWHVTVRRQIGNEPEGPSDPATSPTSQTRMFSLPEG
jgi:hypothetical protein